MTEVGGARGASALAGLFEKVKVMHSSRQWAEAEHDLAAVLGEPAFSDGNGWAAFGSVVLSDESGPEWSLLAKTSDLEAVAVAAADLNWHVGEPVEGAHETRLPLTSSAGLSIVAYSPLHAA
ncbi:hypothetical protein [Brevibacterium yomogidense]|uniref:Uncharacterized protein n=1 Tax=Brevibacterium yomogidense TaxID=946573 RepID=A0A1X6WWC8_9MICO|nr:hypothetical protein [Brevibacterium yomogidense]SLM89843.1 hypothetical protein FM105_01700 [Brevibacterium yomogidense]